MTSGSIATVALLLDVYGVDDEFWRPSTRPTSSQTWPCGTRLSSRIAGQGRHEETAVLNEGWQVHLQQYRLWLHAPTAGKSPGRRLSGSLLLGLNTHCVEYVQCNENTSETKRLLGLVVGVQGKGQGKSKNGKVKTGRGKQ
jgi:hypothetical protein